MVTTLGRQMVRGALPDKYKAYADEPITKKKLIEMTTSMAQQDPDGYIDILQRLNDVGQSVVSTYGKDTALTLDDVQYGAPVADANKKLRAIISTVLNDDSIPNAQKQKRIIDLGYKYSQKVQDLVVKDANDRKTALANQINSGSRGNAIQLMQLMFGNMLMKDALNRDIPYLSVDPYVDGVSPMSYWVGASSGRKGFADVQKLTGMAGYLGKQATNITHATPIIMDDCGTTDTGIAIKAADTQNIGAVLLRPFHKHPAGSIVTSKMLRDADDEQDMIIRSPTTCKASHGVCAKCSGLNEAGKFSSVGQYVALNASKSFIEAATQAGVSCLHPSTMVRMADGLSVKMLASIAAGDSIMGSTKEGALIPVTVTSVFNNGKQPVYMSIYAARDCRSVKLLVRSTLMHKVLHAPVQGSQDKSYRLLPIGEQSAGIIAIIGKRQMVMVLQDRNHIGETPTMDLQVDHEDHLYVLANGLIVSNSKHAGGVGGRKVQDPEGEDQPTGFDSVERMFSAPQTFPGGAVLAEGDGRVTGIAKAPQGGHYITVGSSISYAPQARTVTAKVGDVVSAGDMITNGVPNPLQIVEYKGLGEGRRYYTDKMNQLLKASGWGTARRNVQQFTRSMLNKVRITNDDGYKGYLPGDIADYDMLAADWEPRQDSQTVAPDKALNKYLDAPAMHYTIGTRVTPAVAGTLKKYKFNNVVVNQKEPPFAPAFIRSKYFMTRDKYWLPRLNGQRLTESLFDAAREGKTDPYDSQSFIDKIVAAPYKP